MSMQHIYQSLLSACRNGENNLDVVSALVEAGADPDLQTSQGQTALDLAFAGRADEGEVGGRPWQGNPRSGSREHFLVQLRT